MLELFKHLPRSRPRVLIADDDPSFRQFLCNGFARATVDILEARDGAEALDIGLNQHVDLALVDVHMPHVNGLDVCRTLRQQFSSSDLPVLMVTGSTEAETIKQSFEAGCSDFISKPINATVLKERVKAWLERQHEHQLLTDLAKLLQRGLSAGKMDFVWYQNTTQRMFWSRSFFERTGLSEQDVRDADRLAAHIVPEDRAAFRCLLHSASGEGAAQVHIEFQDQTSHWNFTLLPEYRTSTGAMLLLQEMTNTPVASM